MELRSAILLYGDTGHTMASVHEVERASGDGGCPRLGPGRCLSHAEAVRTLGDLTGQKRNRGLFPPELLSFDGAWMIWYKPSCRRPIFFSTADKAFNAQVGGKEVLHPALLFVAGPSRLHVHALAANSRPREDTRIYIAPYCNLYEGGSMCRGNVALPENLSVSDIPRWEAVFYDTNFTHSNLNKRMTNHPEGHNGMWRALAKRSIKTFPAEWLVSRGKLTLQEVVNQ